MRIFINLLVLLSAFSICAAQTTPDSVFETEALEKLTSLLNLKPSDLQFRDDYTEKDKHRLLSVADLMRRPYGMIEFTEELKSSCQKGQPARLFEFTFGKLLKEGQARRGRSFNPIGSGSFVEGYSLFYNSHEFNRLLSKVKKYLYEALPPAQDSMLGLLNKSEIGFLLKEYREIILDDTADEFRSAEELDSIQQAEEQYVEQFVEFGDRIRKDFILSVGIAAAEDLFDEINSLKAAIGSGELSIKKLLSDTTAIPDRPGIATFLGKHDRWKIGGIGDDYYRGEYDFIIDLGGDDRYDLSYDPEKPHGCIIIDLSGDDIYNGKSEFVIGSGCMSVGLLFDMEGDDIYNGGNFSCGSGYFGFGLLYDGGGSDKYYGDTHTQGAATFGIGLIIDISGSDNYSAALFGQAVGLTEGFGAIVDYSGSDNYIAGNKYKESIGLAGVDVHYLSLSQGFAYGLRPYMSGGIGALLDFDGNDKHITDIYGQGASYWWGLGLLYDGGGSDEYISYQYSQGAGVHMSLGFLLEEEGHDFYRGKGLMQGCGHDYACGMILDRRGNDIYQAWDLSQAAGSANGIGILIDNRGDDTYYAKSTSNTRGYGNPRREFGSIGLFLDLSGEDNYVGLGDNDSYWKTDSKWGGGMDLVMIEPDTSLPEELQPKEVESPQAASVTEKVDILFVIASSGELKYRGMVQSAIDSLIALGAAAVPHLIEKYTTKDARENHAINTILVGIGSDAVPDLVASLSIDNPEQVSRICRSLGEIGDSSAVEGLFGIAFHGDWRVRSSAAVALGKIGDKKADATIMELLSDKNEIVRKSAAVSCRRLKNEKAVLVLIHMMGDSFYGAAHCASEALIELGELVIEPIADSLNSDNELVGNLGCITLGKIGGIAAASAIAPQLESQSPIRRALAVEGILLSNSSLACGFVELIKEKETDPAVLYQIQKVLDKYASQ
jgi:hypothetical protein